MRNIEKGVQANHHTNNNNSKYFNDNDNYINTIHLKATYNQGLRITIHIQRLSHNLTWL